MKVLSRTDLPVSEKVYLAAATITMSESFGEMRRLAERHGLSLPTLYNLREEAQQVLSQHFEPLGSEPGVLHIRLDRAQLERAAVALRTVGPSSVPVILELLPLLYPGLELSYGKLQGVLAEAERRAEKFNAQVTLSRIVAAALDEMFSQGQPILSGIDLASGYVLLLKASEGRSGDDWAKVLAEAKAQGFSPQQVVKDAGKGMDAGLDIEYPDVERRDDAFHASYEVGKVLSRLERRAYSAIELEEKCKRDLKKLAASGADRRGAAQRLRRARERCKQAIELFDSCERQARLVREALEAVDIRKRELRSPEEMERELRTCAAALRALPDAGCRKVGRYLKNRTPGLVLYCKELHEAFATLSKSWGQEVVRHAAVLWQAAELLHLRRQRWTRHLQAEAFRSSWLELRASLEPEKAAELLSAVEQLFARRNRASSALEGFHAALRPHLYVHKGVSQGFLELFRAYYNLHTTRSGRNKGSSAYERLTGQKVDDWPTMLGYPPSSAAERN